MNRGKLHRCKKGARQTNLTNLVEQGSMKSKEQLASTILKTNNNQSPLPSPSSVTTINLATTTGRPITVLSPNKHNDLKLLTKPSEIFNLQCITDIKNNLI